MSNQRVLAGLFFVWWIGMVSTAWADGLNALGRYLGCGWSDGYHACYGRCVAWDTCQPPTAAAPLEHLINLPLGAVIELPRTTTEHHVNVKLAVSAQDCECNHGSRAPEADRLSERSGGALVGCR